MTALRTRLMMFALLAVLGGWTLFESAHMQSNACFDDTGQIVCPIAGPDWVRPLPLVAVLLALLAGSAAVVVRRGWRTPAVVSAFAFLAAGLTVTWTLG